MSELRKKLSWKGVGVYCAGVLIMALGISFSVKSNLGVSPVSSLPYVLSQICGLSLGICTVLAYMLYMLVQVVVLGRAYNPINLTQIIVSLLFGCFTDLTGWIVSPLPATDNYVVRGLYLVIGIACVAMGILLYLAPELISLPGEGATQAISRRFGWKLSNVKIGFDCTVTIVSAILSLIFLHELRGIRVGTLIAALGVGRLLDVFTKLFQTRLTRFLTPGLDRESGRSQHSGKAA